MSHFGPNMNILGTSLLFSYHSPKVGLDCLTDSWRIPWVLVSPIGRTCNTIQLIMLNTNFLICWLKVRLHAGHVPPREMNGSGWVIKFRRTNSHEQNWQNNKQDGHFISNLKINLSHGILKRYVMAPSTVQRHTTCVAKDDFPAFCKTVPSDNCTSVQRYNRVMS